MTDVRILIVDDNPVNQRVVLRQLGRLGFEADAVSDGIEAVLALDRAGYDLVLMDCQMPEMDGFEATREIRTREEGRRHVPIIALTANANNAARAECIAAGMDDYLTKPVVDSELQRVLQQWLPVGERADPLDAEALDRLRALSKGTDDFVREVAALFLEDAPLRLAQVRDAVASMRPDDAASAAHALKSSAGHMGATRVRELAQEIESAAGEGNLERAASSLKTLEVAYARLAERLRALIH